MKCKICKQKTNWDESYGRKEFIVCPKCFNSLSDNISSDLDKLKLVCVICRIGLLIENRKNGMTAPK